MIVNALNKTPQVQAEPKPRYTYTIYIKNYPTGVSLTQTFEGTEYFTDDDGYGNFVDEPGNGQLKRAELVIKLDHLLRWESKLIDNTPLVQIERPTPQMDEDDGDAYDHFVEAVVPQFIPIIGEADEAGGFKTWLTEFAWQLYSVDKWTPAQLENDIALCRHEIHNYFAKKTVPLKAAEMFRTSAVPAHAMSTKRDEQS